MLASLLGIFQLLSVRIQRSGCHNFSLISGETESHRGYCIANMILLIFAASGDEPSSGLFYKVKGLSSFF